MKQYFAKARPCACKNPLACECGDWFDEGTGPYPNADMLDKDCPFKWRDVPNPGAQSPRMPPPMPMPMPISVEEQLREVKEEAGRLKQALVEERAKAADMKSQRDNAYDAIERLEKELHQFRSLCESTLESTPGKRVTIRTNGAGCITEVVVE